METALRRIIRKTGKRPAECRCRLCRRQCRTPCPGTPEDILRLLKAGYRERFAPTRWAVGLLLGKIPYIVPMVQAKQEAGGCIFFQDGLCELYAAGLKPTGGRLSHYTITMENLKFGMSLSWNVTKEWLNERNSGAIREIVRIMGKQMRDGFMNEVSVQPADSSFVDFMEPPLINSYHLQTVRISRGYPLSGKHLSTNDTKLKSRMTVGKMSEHLTERTGKFTNHVPMGRYAKELGYAVYKSMINGRICQFYVNPSIKDDGGAETLRTNERENGHERE